MIRRPALTFPPKPADIGNIKPNDPGLGLLGFALPSIVEGAERPVRMPTVLWWQRPPAFQRHNVRWNPFGDTLPAELGTMAVVNDSALSIAPFQPLQILAPAGHGKTTHLLALQARHAGATYEYVPLGQHSVRTQPSPDRLFLLDEAQRVRPSQLRDLFMRQPWLAVATHEDLQQHCPHPLRTLRIEPLSMVTLRTIVSRRMEWARADPRESLPAIDDVRLTQLLQSHGGNLRAILEELYDRIQRDEM
jgi:hypothetical protein